MHPRPSAHITVALFAAGLAGAAAAAWWALGQGPAPIPAPSPPPVFLQQPQVDLQALDADAAALPVPREALERARRGCRLGSARECEFRKSLEAQAAKSGVG